MRASRQCDVAGANDFDASALEAKAERSVGFDSIEPARDPLARATVNVKRRSNGMSAG